MLDEALCTKISLNTALFCYYCVAILLRCNIATFSNYPLLSFIANYESLSINYIERLLRNR